ncbi:MAG: enoyl-CoA hydratase/isomerase family protein, partial [Desulfobacterales bacterium]
AFIEEIKRDDEVRVAILTGNGRNFCAGTDISSGELTPPPKKEKSARQADQEPSDYETGFPKTAFSSIAKPTVCAINGAAVGLGSEYPLHCDVRIASESARFGQIFVLRGLTPDTGAGTYLLPHIVGFSKACELVFSGEIIDAQEMLRIGLVSKVVPDDALMPAALEMARKLKRGAPLAVKKCKQQMYMGLQRTMEEHQKVNAADLQSMSGAEIQEGIASFLEGREPRWTK